MKSALIKAIDEMLNGTREGVNDYSVALLIIGCVIHDVRLAANYELPGHPLFKELLDTRDEAFDRGDMEAIEQLKADARTALEYGRDQAIKLGDAAARRAASVN